MSEEQGPKLIVHKKDYSDKKPELIPKEFSSVYADKVMVAIDEKLNIVSLTLLSMHFVPKLEPNGSWGLDNVRWDVIAEVKMPIPTLNTMIVHYLHQMTGGINIVPILEKYSREHPKTSQESTYGPLDVKDAVRQKETTGGQV